MTVYRHFTIETLAPGVYMAHVKPGGSLGCNTGIIDLGDRTLIFDTGLTIPAAQELRSVAAALTGREASLVINSHSHPDHIHGNAAFPDALLIASDTTRQAIANDGPRRMENIRRQIQGDLAAIDARLAQNTDEAELLETRVQLQAFLADLPTPDDLRIPHMGFGQSLTIHGSTRSARLLTFGGVHSPCDAILYLPQEQILFGGDLAIPEGNQILDPHGRPEAWLQILDKVEALGSKLLVPGHGPVLPTDETLSWARTYLHQIMAITADAQARGVTSDKIGSLTPPAGCAGRWFEHNMRILLGVGSRS